MCLEAPVIGSVENTSSLLSRRTIAASRPIPGPRTTRLLLFPRNGYTDRVRTCGGILPVSNLPLGADHSLFTGLFALGCTNDTDHVAIFEKVCVRQSHLVTGVNTVQHLCTQFRVYHAGHLFECGSFWNKIGIRQYFAIMISQAFRILDGIDDDHVQELEECPIDRVLNPGGTLNVQYSLPDNLKRSLLFRTQLRL